MRRCALKTAACVAKTGSGQSVKNAAVFSLRHCNAGRNDNRSLNADGSYEPNRDWFLQNVRMQNLFPLL
jgi:hypothetical protein